ncbi:MAG: Zn-ribbon domain-containing OB-fold protein [Nitrosotalea sp.]
MNKFEQELSNNNFICAQCTRCGKLVWPPSEFCNKCFSDVIWRPVSKFAKLIEFSRKDNKFFCIAEFEDSIRVMGSVENASDLQIGQSLFLIKCHYDEKEIFMFEPASTA